MFGSDETVLAQVGTAKLWPLYVSYANESKYRRGKMSLRLVEQLAYLEKVSQYCCCVAHVLSLIPIQLPDKFKDFYLERSGLERLHAPLLTHCQRELYHQQWLAILDDEFMEAYDHGFVIKCFDGIERRFYPRVFTYSADYPEK
jgi:hypothetical protein